MRAQGFAEDGCTAKELNFVMPLLSPVLLERINAFDNAFFNAFGHGGVFVVFIAQGHVVIDIFLFLVHASNAVLDDDGNFVSVGRVVGNTVGNG